VGVAISLFPPVARTLLSANVPGGRGARPTDEGRTTARRPSRNRHYGPRGSRRRRGSLSPILQKIAVGDRSSPESVIIYSARSTIFTGAPMSSTNISPPFPMAPACKTSWEASGMVMKYRTMSGWVTVTGPPWAIFARGHSRASSQVCFLGYLDSGGWRLDRRIVTTDSITR